MDAELMTEEIVAEFREEIKELLELREQEEKQETGKERLNRFEQGLRRRLNRFGAKIERRHIELEGSKQERGLRYCDGCGGQMRNVSRETITVQSVFGPMEVTRTRFRCEKCKRTEYPLDGYYGWEKHRYTPTAKEWVCLMCQGDAYPESVEILGRVTGIEGAVHVFREIVQECGAQLLEQRAEQVRQVNETDQPLKGGEPPTPWMVVGVDGCQILKSGEMVGKRKKGREKPEQPLRAGKRRRGDRKKKRQHGQQTKGDQPERGMEVKVGFVGALVENAEGTYEIEKKSFVSTLEKVEPFTDYLFCESVHRGVVDCEQVVVMGDGSSWIWNRITPLYPHEKRIDILDWYHLSENVWETAEALYGSRESWPTINWVEQQLDKLEQANAVGVLRALECQDLKWKSKRGEKAQCAQQAIHDLQHYLEENKSRMDYPRYRSLGLPISTGDVESACKVVVGSRMKRSGMQWRAKGAEPILHLRAEFKSRRWDEDWRKLRAAA